MKNKTFIKGIFIMTTALGIGFFLLSHTEQHYAKENSKEIFESDTFATHFLLPSKLRGRRLPFHRIYEPRLVRLPCDLQQAPVLLNKTKVILLWTPWNGVQKTINFYSLQQGNVSFVKYKCPYQKCTVTSSREHLRSVDAVLFHLLDTKSTDLPSYRSEHQLWIMYNMEPPWLIKKHKHSELHYFKNIFNWTMSYRSDSDVIARYGFIAPSHKTINNTSFSKKTKNVVWFVSDCRTDSRREEYVKELSKYIDVDIYGSCGRHKCYPAQSATCYDQVLEKYKFYLSFENAICKDYVTEKFFNVFNFDIIPIVFGAVNYSSIAPEGSFIDATQYSHPERLAVKLHEISNSEHLFRNYLLNKRTFRAYLDPWVCRLCKKLHTGQKPSTLSDVNEWWLKEAQCKTWNNEAKDLKESMLL